MKGNDNFKVVNISDIKEYKDQYIKLYQKYLGNNNSISEWAQWKIDYVNRTCDELDERDKLEKRLDNIS